MTEAQPSLLTVKEISIAIGDSPIVKQVSFSLHQGEILVIVGESGSGKTTILKACAGMLPDTIRITNGSIAFEGRPLVRKDDWLPLRGRDMNYVFQDSLSSFCPVRSIYDQLWDAARTAGMNRNEFDKTAADRAAVLDLPKGSLSSYPQELSGGMVQRAGLLFPLIIPPRLVFADEPTSAVDSVTQKKMADALLRLRRHHQTAIILVTHDIRLAAYMADTLLILRQGHVEEYGPAKPIIAHPGAAYTERLLTLAGMRKESVPCSLK
ncbi:MULTISPECIES: dipeptide/oligopeptide/nickel ABC transporter ATP-binding protein [unclassified Megasphaera]|uniref:ABC transporter ATP-binding protein n=1 Tax=unclassified Megasphaera TaxID=2626256 RepID=UPI000ED745B2|nr:ATP-binding cassette domain-containing protein [Megasphaera sp. UBA4233]HAM04991.1 ABC transporter ATP-binding protein [Megasphaera sp.]